MGGYSTDTGDLVHDPANIVQGKGDICKYLASQGWAPPGNWCLPTKDELVFMLKSGGSWVDGTNTSGNNAGTNSIASGWKILVIIIIMDTSCRPQAAVIQL
ncbi:hypothetical protein [Dysgonomonas sp. HGC4]|uniref:hypothetical protein n=1 Tax=Dysgonomonas sp. HGC4 TaxID=1658009 RepID=UPI00177EBAE9|nr:hypothetical protein [Dysgonomonas sp. HGC4]MBD8348064.1 hypothetical protein [Dysgonomonas sp. HGC4]